MVKTLKQLEEEQKRVQKRLKEEEASRVKQKAQFKETGEFKDVKTGAPTGFVKDGGEFIGQTQPEQVTEFRERQLQKKVIPPTPEEAAATALRESVSQDPTQFGLETPLPPEQQQAPPPTTGAPVQQGVGGRPDQGSLFSDLIFGFQRAPDGTPIASNVAPFAVGGAGFFDPGKAVKAGTAVKWLAKLSPVKKSIAASIAVWTTLTAAEKVADATLLRQVDEQKSAMGKLAEITSTIVGDSTSAAGNWRLGLQEMRDLEKQMLKLESDSQAGIIKKPVLKIRGEIIDMNAETFDGLATVQEGIRDIQSFVLEGRFPELTPFEIQTLLRELEADGFLEVIDLTTSRRET